MLHHQAQRFNLKIENLKTMIPLHVHHLHYTVNTLPTRRLTTLIARAMESHPSRPNSSVQLVLLVIMLAQQTTLPFKPHLQHKLLPGVSYSGVSTVEYEQMKNKNEYLQREHAEMQKSIKRKDREIERLRSKNRRLEEEGRNIREQMPSTRTCQSRSIYTWIFQIIMFLQHIFHESNNMSQKFKFSQNHLIITIFF
eukprot:NP_508886.2 Uncharacterized protein CELE_H28G03.3 [Caenorhabditis elegans]